MLKFEGQKARKDEYAQLCESRFDLIEKSPGNLSNVRRSPKVNFGKT